MAVVKDQESISIKYYRDWHMMNHAINPIVTADNTSRLKIASGTETRNMYIIVIINHSERGIQ